MQSRTRKPSSGPIDPISKQVAKPAKFRKGKPGVPKSRTGKSALQNVIFEEGGFSERKADKYRVIFDAPTLDRIDVIKAGIPARAAKELIKRVGITQDAGYMALLLSPATVNKKAKQGLNLSPSESERVLGFATLVGQVQALVEESGEPEGFDAEEWMARWLSEPVPALGGARPMDLLDTMEGQALVSRVLAQMQTGAYA